MSEESSLKTTEKEIDPLTELRTEYSSLLAEVKELEQVYYLMKLEISSLLCEKDFLITSLDEINMLILKRQEQGQAKLIKSNMKRESQNTSGNQPKKNSYQGNLKDTGVNQSYDQENVNDTNTVLHEQTMRSEETVRQQIQIGNDDKGVPYQPNIYSMPSSMTNPNLCYSYVPQSYSQVQPSNQFLPMMHQNYSNLPQTMATSPYQLISPQPNFFLMNSANVGGSVPGVVNQTRELPEQYMRIPLSNPAPYVQPHLQPGTK